MVRAVSLFVMLGLAAAVADARTPLRVCRKACRPLVSSVCPPKGKALRQCRKPIVRSCRREGVAACAIPIDPPAGGSLTTTTTTPGAVVTTTSTTITAPSETTTTTTLPPGVPSVAGTWRFDGAVVQRGCGYDESYDVIESQLNVLQQAAALSGSMVGIEGRQAAGEVTGGGWSFATTPDCRPLPASTEVCCLSFAVSAAGFASPATAAGTATAQCDGPSSCVARWNGSVTRVD